LPVQPSPVVFRFLNELVGEMAGVGVDVWSPGAVEGAKDRVRREVAVRVRGLKGKEMGVGDVNGNSEEGKETEDHEEGPKEMQEGEEAKGEEVVKEEPDHDFEIQLLFDMFYLLAATSTPKKKEQDELSNALAGVEEAAQLSQAEKDRIRKAADEYWKRTSLLFALLA